MVQRFYMPSFEVRTPGHSYHAMVERGLIARTGEFVPEKSSQVFVVTTRDVWDLHGDNVQSSLKGRRCTVLFFPGGEENKRLHAVESLAEQMVEAGGDRASVIIAFGGGIVTDVAGFLAAIFLRGIPVIQVPTTLLAQVDAAVGGKTGVNLVSGKNLIGSFHQPLAVLIDPTVIATLPEREYRAGLCEILKCGVIRSPRLFELMTNGVENVLRHESNVVEEMIAESVRIKAEVVSADEREGDLRRILNFGHTIGHALEAETAYKRFLHGEAVAFGMLAATELAAIRNLLDEPARDAITRAVLLYGPIPPLDGIAPERLLRRLASDKKTLHGRVHFVLPTRIGEVRIVSDVPDNDVLRSIDAAIGHTERSERGLSVPQR